MSHQRDVTSVWILEVKRNFRPDNLRGADTCAAVGTTSTSRPRPVHWGVKGWAGVGLGS